VRGKSIAVLFALAVAPFAPSLGVAQYTPKWHVGDWWVTKTLEESHTGWGWTWRYTRYDVVRVEKLGRRDCFVLMTRTAGPNGEIERDTIVSYVRVDDWLVVRQEIANTYNGKPRPRIIHNAPLGLFGPFAQGEPRLPRFPLRLGDPDTTFKLQKRDDGLVELREISRIADSASVKRLLDDGDSTGRQVVRPTGSVYQVRDESGGDLGTDNSRIGQSLQLWSNDLPWRAYEERVLYDGPKPTRRVFERTWLVAASRQSR